MNYEVIVVKMGRDNQAQYQITQDEENVPEGAVTRAILQFGSWRLDTDSDPGISVSLAGVLTVTPGHIPDLAPGLYRGSLVIFDAASSDGIEWGKFVVIVEADRLAEETT